MALRSRMARFAIYGALGVGAEVAFTALKGFLRDRTAGFHGHASPWMFPIYGLLQPLFEPVHDAMRGRATLGVRAVVYAGGFLAVEYGTGRILRRTIGRAPWDYSAARWNIDGLIRWDYAPMWAAVGLVTERVHDRLTGR